MAELNKSMLDLSTERLFYSIFGGEDVVTIQTLLQEGADIEAIYVDDDSKGTTPLLLACSMNQKNNVDLLIKSGANVDVKYHGDWTVLHLASREGWIEIVRTLVKKVSDLDARDSKGETAMHYAARSGCLEVVKYLVEEGADTDKKNLKDFTPLLCAADASQIDVVELLLNSRASIGGDEGLLLHCASRNGWTKLVHYLVKKVPDLNKWYRNGHAVFHVASMVGHLEIVKCLVEHGTDINTRNDCGQTALHVASEENHPEIAKWLVEQGADINTRDKIGETALHGASRNGNLEVVKYLVKKGTDINLKDCERNYMDVRDIYGITALGEACISLKYDIAHYLLQAGASWDIETKRGKSPLNKVITIKEEPEFKFIKLFIENGAYLKRVDYEAIVKSSSLKVLQDEELCWQAIVNKFHNHDLAELYKLPASGCLPCIERMKIASGSEVAQEIKRAVGFEIQAKGYCNILEVRPMALSIFSVRSVLEYCERNNSKL